MIGSMSNLAPGDLVFFANTGGRGGISHVAIYIGGGQIVHAMTPRYGVQISGVWSSYWQSHFAGAIPVCVDGLGPRGGGAHTPAEWVSAASLRSRAEVALAVVSTLHSGR